MEKEELEMKVVAWNHRAMATITKANSKITEKEALFSKILILINSNELTKQVLYHSLKNNHLGRRNIGREVSIQMPPKVILHNFLGFQGLPTEVTIFLD